MGRIGRKGIIISMTSPFSFLPSHRKNKKAPEALDFTGLSGEAFGVPEVIRTPDLPLRRSPRGAFLTPCKSPKILDFTGFSGVSLSINSRLKPANFSWFFAFLLAGY